MQLYFIRHAQSENNKKWSETGSSSGRVDDPGLTDVGKQQAQYLAGIVHLYRPDARPSPLNQINEHSISVTHLYTSLMARAILTGHYVAEKTGLPLVGLVDAHEGGGIYLDDEGTGQQRGLPGKTPQELKFLSSHLVLPEINSEGWWNRPYEEREERLSRGKRVLDWILSVHGATNDRIVLISHADFFNYLLAAILKQDERLPVWFYINNAGIARIDFFEGGTVLVYSNRTDHLPAELLT